MTPPELALVDYAPGPDLNPLYPTPQSLLELLDGSTLTPSQRTSLVAHALLKAVSFGDITLLTFLLRSPLARGLVDLGVRDEDGLGFVSQAITGFGEESDKDVEREEVVRLLVSEGADYTSGDNGEPSSRVCGSVPLTRSVLSPSWLDASALRRPSSTAYSHNLPPHTWSFPTLNVHSRLNTIRHHLSI